MHYRDRIEAGQILADELLKYADGPNLLVLALPRGGVPVAFEVAKALGAKLDVFLVRKLGLPGHEELAMGAVADGGVRVLNADVIGPLQVPDELIDTVAQRESMEIQRQRRLYRDAHAAPRIEGRVVILVDDGLATGSTMRAAIAALRQQSPKRLVVAVPVGAPETCDELAADTDDLICPLQPQHFIAVGAWYEDFSPISDETVRSLLQQGSRWNQRDTKATVG